MTCFQSEIIKVFFGQVSRFSLIFFGSLVASRVFGLQFVFFSKNFSDATTHLKPMKSILSVFFVAILNDFAC